MTRSDRNLRAIRQAPYEPPAQKRHYLTWVVGLVCGLGIGVGAVFLFYPL